ncbi:putative ATPase, AAA-type, core, P-loop containing nucleoside triphosphate hydrolase [Rosa chinensis]|uniref:Putative ATPase, AAA-type, core, P-loop containing nucleoside triphosphate hydrolase n=1 Tax=Rosa chinensis TaxID=74649 RepID=A0A2P6RM08_ROSCH|nr:putative ATPase, AAA-type, core, P-loop containing nucleoside triphosphate hydrolase [Rosa chinensis]
MNIPACHTTKSLKLRRSTFQPRLVPPTTVSKPAKHLDRRKSNLPWKRIKKLKTPSKTSYSTGVTRALNCLTTTTATLQCNSSGIHKRHFELAFHKNHKAKVTESYLPYVLEQAKAIKEKENIVKLYTRHGNVNYAYGSRHGNVNYAYGGSGDGIELGIWRSISLEHPATFETMAMEPELKRTVIEDLDRFVRRKNFYRKVGKAWKRGYLLYGPPGTGKSSLVAAMANYLKFDVYDLELASVSGNAQLRNVLLSTTN